VIVQEHAHPTDQGYRGCKEDEEEFQPKEQLKKLETYQQENGSNITTTGKKLNNSSVRRLQSWNSATEWHLGHKR
jgi:hypothetical protein